MLNNREAGSAIFPIFDVMMSCPGTNQSFNKWGVTSLLSVKPWNLPVLNSLPTRSSGMMNLCSKDIKMSVTQAILQTLQTLQASEISQPCSL
jgi:hypothetical protein